MKSGMIKNVAVTPVNVIDADVAKFALPRTGFIFADKGYIEAIDEIKRRLPSMNEGENPIIWHFLENLPLGCRCFL
jgi:hypothetical protein